MLITFEQICLMIKSVAASLLCRQPIFSSTKHVIFTSDKWTDISAWPQNSDAPNLNSLFYQKKTMMRLLLIKRAFGAALGEASGEQSLWSNEVGGFVEYIAGWIHFHCDWMDQELALTEPRISISFVLYTAGWIDFHWMDTELVVTEPKIFISFVIYTAGWIHF